MSLTFLPRKPSARHRLECGVARQLSAALAVLGSGLVVARTPAEKSLASEPFRIIAPFLPGGPVDTLSRILRSSYSSATPTQFQSSSQYR